MTPKEVLNELEKAEWEATQPGWMVKTVGHGVARIAARAIVLGDTDSIDWRPADYTLIVAARNALPSLLADARALAELLAALPKCCWDNCTRTATRLSYDCYGCDEHDRSGPELPYAPIVRKLEKP